MFDHRLSISRISVKQVAKVEILRVESPDSFFVRPVNHIANQLVYSEPLRLLPFSDYAVGRFALAPIGERTFGRCVILEKHEKEQCAKVFFVDHGSEHFVHNSCIFKIDVEQCLYPWQVIHAGLARCQTINENEWSQEQCTKFEKLLTKFESFEMTATDYDLDTNSDRGTVKINLFGTPIDGEESVSIEDIFASTCPLVCRTVLPSNYKNPQLSSGKNTEIYIDPVRLNFPDNWQFEKSREIKEEDDEWEMRPIPNFILSSSSNLIGYVDCASTISPYEMYVRVIQREEENDDEFVNDDWLVEDYEKVVEFSQNLDDFYRDVNNQKPLSYDEIIGSFENGRTFGVCSSSTKNNASWHRVEILGVQNESVHIRYLDIGGMTHVKLRQIHRLNVIHASQPPFCVQVKVNSIHENEDVFWSADLCQTWAELIPYDVPIQFNSIVMNYETGSAVSSDLGIYSENGPSMIDQFVKKSHGRVKYFC